MAYETEYANIVKPTDALSDITGAALVQKAVLPALVYSEDVPVGTMIKKFVKDGYLTADVLAESTAVSFGAGNELTQSSVSATVTKYVGAAKLTAEAERFTRMTSAEMAGKVGEAIARDIDGDIKALASSFSNTVTATDVLTLDDIMLGDLSIRENTLNVSEGSLVFIGNNQGIYDLKKDIVQSAAAVFTQEKKTSLLDGVSTPAGYVGSALGTYDFYVTSGMPTSSSDDVNLLFDPRMAFAGVIDPTVNMDVQFMGASSGLYNEITGWVWANFVEWYDEAGCGILSDT